MQRRRQPSRAAQDLSLTARVVVSLARSGTRVGCARSGYVLPHAILSLAHIRAATFDFNFTKTHLRQAAIGNSRRPCLSCPLFVSAWHDRASMLVAIRTSSSSAAHRLASRSTSSACSTRRRLMSQVRSPTLTAEQLHSSQRRRTDGCRTFSRGRRVGS